MRRSEQASRPTPGGAFRHSRAVLVVLGLSLALKLAVLFAVGDIRPILDERQYLKAGQSVAAGNGVQYPFKKWHSLHQGPMYPYALGLVFKLGGGAFESKFLQVLLRCPNLRFRFLACRVTICAMSESLADKNCVPCRGGVPPLTAEQIGPLLSQLDGWDVLDKHHLSKSYAFPNFATALAFVNRVGSQAEEQGHHPDIFLAWGNVRLEIWTHKIDGLTESDFIFAARCDRVRPTG